MLPSTDRALLVSVTVLLVGGIVIASAAPALAGSHASTAADADTISTTAVQDNDRDWNVQLSSNEIVWQNQRAYFNGAEVVNNASIQPVRRASTEARTFEIRTVENDSIGTVVEEFTVNETGAAILDMQGFEPQEYVIVYEEMPILVDDGEGEFTSDVSEASFGVAIQNLSASFDPDQVSLDESATLELESNRDEYIVSINATGLHQAQVDDMIMDTFDNSSLQNGTRVRVDDDELELLVGDVPIDPGVYDFDVNVLRSQASDTASLTVGDPENTTGDTGGVGTPGDGPGTPGTGDEDMFTDTPGNDTDVPTEDTPTQSSPAGEDETPTDGGTETTTTTGPGFGLLVAVIGLLGAGLLARRRTN